MKKFKITVMVCALILSMSVTAFAAEIPRESAPLNATEEAICITENLIGDILDEVKTENKGYTEACGEANTRVRKAVIAGETGGYGYGILSAVTQNAILDIRDMYLRPEVYAQAEEQLKLLIADLIEDVANGGDYETALKTAYTRIYQMDDVSYRGENDADICYLDNPSIDSAYFNRARKLLKDSLN